MRCNLFVPVLAAAALIASPALAGGEGCAAKGATLAKADGAQHEKCTKTGEECKKAMLDAKSRGWAGLELDKAEDGRLVVTRVNPTSPAARAGFLNGDVLLALNGVALTDDNHEKLAKVKSTMKPGTEVLYTVDRKGAKRHLTVALGQMPEAVFDEMVARHMADHDGGVAAN